MEVMMNKITLEKLPVRNAIVVALNKRHSGGSQAHKSRNQRRQTKHSWKKEQW